MLVRQLAVLGGGYRPYHSVAAAGVLDAELDVALVVDTAGVGELVRLEPHQGGRLPRAVLELAHDLVIHGTPVLTTLSVNIFINRY